MFNLASFTALRSRQHERQWIDDRSLSLSEQGSLLALSIVSARNPGHTLAAAEAFWSSPARQHHLARWLHSMYPHMIGLQRPTLKSHKWMYRKYIRYSIRAAVERLQDNWHEGVPLDTSIDLAEIRRWLEHVLDLNPCVTLNFLWDIDEAAQLRSLHRLQMTSSAYK
ncbi:hypothetical protein CLM74_06515 [Stenotrophomonas sp. MYb57]|nr:hypothetical protein CLM74_06515 [Stenotrophomonas sp. MYb57]